MSISDDLAIKAGDDVAKVIARTAALAPEHTFPILLGAVLSALGILSGFIGMIVDKDVTPEQVMTIIKQVIELNRQGNITNEDLHIIIRRNT